MKIAALVLALTVDLVLPRYRQVTGGDCSSVGDPLTTLDSLYVWTTPQYAYAETLLVALRVRGFEGFQVTFEVPRDPSTLRIYTTNTAHARSCDFYATVSSHTTGVPDQVNIGAKGALWYDLAGRRLRAAPKTPGVYVRVIGRERRKVVVLR